MSRVIVAALWRSSRHFTSPVSVRTFSSSFSSLVPTFTLPPSSSFAFSISNFSSSSSSLPKTAANSNGVKGAAFDYKTSEDVEVIEDWEEEEEVEARLGDGGDGGGLVLGGVSWADKALSIASQLVKESEQDLQLFAFRTTLRGYIYVRLDKLANQYGCPTMDELEDFSREFKKRLDDAGAQNILPEDLALEVSSPGAERLLRVPQDLQRFKELPMTVTYEGETNSRKLVKSAVFLLESLDAESEICIWKLADVRENRDPESKGRPLNRKQKDLRVNLPFTAHRKINLYLD